MLETSKLSLFLTAAIILVLTPGPAVLYVMAKGIDQGWKAGVASVLGVESGTLVHVAATTLGISSILITFPTIFDLIRILSVIYLFYLGCGNLMTPHKLVETSTSRRESLGSAFSQGMMVALLNPQTAIFFLAFLPQFVDPAQGTVPLQFLTLGIIFVLLAVVVEGSYALLAGSLSIWLKNRPHLIQAQHYLAGLVYIGLGVLAALASFGR